MIKMSIEIHAYDPSKDYEAVKGMVMKLTGHLGADFNERQFRITISRRKSDRVNKEGILLARDPEKGDKIVGMVWGEVTINKVGKISNFIIDKDYRGQGLGNKLVQKVIDFFTKHRVNKMQANVRNLEKEGRLYEKFGFKRKYCTMQR